ncbi:MFS transporter [Parvibium lacunae]|uniref:Major facilitator superfamily associated domain-containing protein n=1 Tax=Parvibium lacunae TaxID=1888893 RepID=A0A368L8F0_9BURK|nr:MFS transporter [Parvibium lacunae]RCS59832.1 hypothetical protein DU000_03785 [Parvibium lacunae]
MKQLLQLPGATALVAFFTLYFAYIGMFAPYFPLYLDARGLSAAEIGLMLSVLQGVRIVGPWLWAWVADHTGQPARIMQASLAISLLFFVGLYVFAGWWPMLCLLVGFTLFSSGQVPLSEVLTRQVLAQHYDQYGRLRLFGSIGFIVAVWAVGPALDYWGIETLPHWIVACFLVLLWVNMKLPRAIVDHAALPTASFWAQLCQPGVAWFMLSATLMVAAHSCLYTYFSLYLDSLGYRKSLIGFLWGVGVVAEVMLFYGQHHLLQRYAGSLLLTLCFGACVLRWLLVAWAGEWLTVLLFAQVLHALTFALHHTLTMRQLQRWFHGRTAARGQALYASLAYGVGATCGGLLCTYWWTSYSHSTVFLMSAMVALLGALALWFSLLTLSKESR